jgi:hypothetical protein
MPAFFAGPHATGVARGLQTIGLLVLEAIAKRSLPMADPTRNESTVEELSDLAAAARDRGMEQLEGANGRLAEGAERVAAAVDRTADELEGDGDDAISGFGRSLASVMRQLAGGLRERDIERFAGELGLLARRNPGVFLAGSVALGFGVARFFKARAPQSRSRYDYDGDGRDDGPDPDGRASPDGAEFDADESLDLSGNPEAIARRDSDEAERSTIGKSKTTAQRSAPDAGGKEP